MPRLSLRARDQLISESKGVCVICKGKLAFEDNADGLPYEFANIVSSNPNGPRYDPHITAEIENSPENYLVLCSNCHGRIDSDSEYFTSSLLKDIKNGKINLADDVISHQNLGVRMKYLNRISEFLGSRGSYKRSPKSILEIINKFGFEEYSQTIQTIGLPDSTTIIDGFLDFALSKESKVKTGVWRKQLVDALNSLFVAYNYNSDWLALVKLIPPRELEKAGITYKSSSKEFDTCRPRTNDGDDALLFNDDDISWFAELLSDHSIIQDLEECFLLKTGISLKGEYKNNRPLEIAQLIVRKANIDHQAHGLLYSLECLQKRHNMNEEIMYAIEVLKEAIYDWGPRIERIDTTVTVITPSRGEPEDAVPKSTSEDTEENKHVSLLSLDILGKVMAFALGILLIAIPMLLTHFSGYSLPDSMQIIGYIIQAGGIILTFGVLYKSYQKRD